MTDKISAAKWIEELEKLSQRSSDEGMTVGEWGEALGCGPRTARGRLGLAHRAGRLVVGRRSVTGIDGRRMLVPVYRVVPAGDGKEA